MNAKHVKTICTRSAAIVFVLFPFLRQFRSPLKFKFNIMVYSVFLLSSIYVLWLRRKMKRKGSLTSRMIGGRKVGVRTDWNLCVGASSCVEIAPKVFPLDWQRKKSVFDPAPLEILDEKGADPETIFLAAQSCPYRAIILEDEETGERIFPWG